MCSFWFTKLLVKLTYLSILLFRYQKLKKKKKNKLSLSGVCKSDESKHYEGCLMQ